jgi:hypothetical protein
MKFLHFVILTFAGTPLASNLPENRRQASQVHKQVMAAKMATWARQETLGAFDSRRHPELGYTPCSNGKAEAIEGNANYTFRCNNVRFPDLYGHQTDLSNRSISITFCPTRNSAAKVALDPPLGVGHHLPDENSSPSAKETVLLSPRSQRMESYRILEGCLIIQSQACGEKFEAMSIT